MLHSRDSKETSSKLIFELWILNNKALFISWFDMDQITELQIVKFDSISWKLLVNIDESWYERF